MELYRRLWLALIVTLIINIVACVLLLVAGASDGGKDMIGAAVYIPFISAGSLFLWYRFVDPTPCSTRHLD